MLSPAGRRRLATRVRHVVAHADRPAGARSFLLVDRVGAVRADMLAVAALLESSPALTAGDYRELNGLLTDGVQSPLYCPQVHISELKACLYFVRARLDPSHRESASHTTGLPERADRPASLDEAA